MKFFSHCIFFFLLLSGCDSSRVYEKNFEFRNHTWKANDPQRFEFEISDTTNRYNLYLNVRNSLEYPYARLFINYELSSPKQNKVSSELLPYYLFDQKTGEPFGKSGIGDVFDHRFLLLKQRKFNEMGTYRVRLEQFMRLDTLIGVVAVGLRVEKNKPE